MSGLLTVSSNEKMPAALSMDQPCKTLTPGVGGGGGTLGVSGWGCAAGTLKALTYTRASPAEFGYPILK